MLGRSAARFAASARRGDDPAAGLLCTRHTCSPTRGIYDAIYRRGALMNLRRHRRWLLDVAEVRPGMRLLDVACGEAGLVCSAADRGLDVQGVDQSVVALRIGQPGLPPSALVAADGHALPYEDEAFDRVMSIGSLEHYLDPVTGAAEIARILAPDGLACVLLPNAFGLRSTVLWAWLTGEVYDDGQPLQRYGTRCQWTRLLEAGGLRVERVLGYESHGELPRGPAELLGFVRHPTRLLIPFSRWLPVDMATMLVFVCRKG